MTIDDCDNDDHHCQIVPISTVLGSGTAQYETNSFLNPEGVVRLRFPESIKKHKLGDQPSQSIITCFYRARVRIKISVLIFAKTPAVESSLKLTTRSTCRSPSPQIHVPGYMPFFS